MALFDSSDKCHSKTIDFIKSNEFPLVTPIASITEALHLLDFNRNAQLDLLEWIHRGGVEICNIGNIDFGRIKESTSKYKDLPMDFADSYLVFLAEQLSLDTITTIDRDFTIYRISGKRKFKIVPS